MFEKIKYTFVNLKKNRVVANIIIVSILTMLVKGVGFLKEMQVGQAYGLSALLDTFLIASLVPTFVNNVFMLSFQNLFIPNYIKQLRQSPDIGGFQSACFLITFFFGAILMILSYLITDANLEEFYSGHTTIYYQAIRLQLVIMAPCIFFWAFSSLLAGLLEIQGLFHLTAVYSIITSLITLILIIFFKDYCGERILAISLLIGSFFEFVYLLILCLINKIITIKRPDFKAPFIKELVGQLPSKIGASFLSGSTTFINQFFAAQLVVGSLASFNYGIKIPSFLVSLLAIALGNVILPYFSKMVVDNKEQAFRVLFKLIVYVFIGSIFVVGFGIWVTEMMIEFLFEKDNFTHADTLVVAEIQRILLLFVPFYISGVILNKFLTSLNKNIYMLYASIFNLIMSVILNFYLSKYYGILGLAIATTLISVINFIVLYVVVLNQKKRFDGII